MENKNELGLYRINPKYIDALSEEKQGGDKRVQQVRENGKFQRPFIGIVVMCNNQQYCIPLTKTEGKAKLDGKNGAKKGSIDYSPIYIDGKLKAGIQFSRMIPVEESQLRTLDMKDHIHDLPNQKKEKQLRRDELAWVQENKDIIINKARTLYERYLSGEPFKRKTDCLNFPQLEKLCKRYCKEHPSQHHHNDNHTQGGSGKQSHENVHDTNIGPNISNTAIKKMQSVLKDFKESLSDIPKQLSEAHESCVSTHNQILNLEHIKQTIQHNFGFNR